MRIELTPLAKRQPRHIIEYGIKRFGKDAAEQTAGKVRRMIDRDLATFPSAGTYHEDRDIFERAVSGAPFVILYRYPHGSERLTVLAIFGHSQNRDSLAG